MARLSVNHEPAAAAPHPADSLADTQIEASARRGESEKPTLHGRFISTVATLECVLSVLEQESDQMDRNSHLASAEMVLRQSIAALHDISSEVAHV